MRSILLGLVVLLAACSDSEPPDTGAIDLPEPTAVVGQWLDAIGEVDVSRLELLVEPTGLALLAGVENRIRSAEMASLLDSGVTGQLAQGYWQSFRDEFEVFRSVPVESIVVGEVRPIASTPNHVAVEVSNEEQTALVVLRDNAPLGWQVDVIATFGSGLVGQLREYLESAVAGEYGLTIAEAYSFAVVPGLDAAIALNPNDALLVFETEFIRQLVAG